MLRILVFVFIFFRPLCYCIHYETDVKMLQQFLQLVWENAITRQTELYLATAQFIQST